MSSEPAQDNSITRREAVRRVSALLGGVALVGGSALLTACDRERERPTATAAGAANGRVGEFTAEDVALLDEIADTILPDTSTPGAKAARVGPFMALMVTDSYSKRDQQVFREGMRAVDAESRKAANATFVAAAPAQRLALLERLDREQKAHTDAREAAKNPNKGTNTAGTVAPRADAAAGDAPKADKYLPDERQENAPNAEVGAGGAEAVSDDPPAHYFRMMKELALLGYFTSEIGVTQAQRYVESPGRYDPCAPYKPGDRAWAPHA